METDKKNCIEVTDVGYRINGNDILNDISISINAGDFVGIIGPNGAGKSTFARLLVNVLKPTSGNIDLSGQELSGINFRELYKKIAFIPQNLDFTFPFTVIDTVLMGRMPYMGRFEFEKDYDYQLAEQALRTVGMEEFSEREVTSLSGGEKQLVALAKAIVQQTDFLVLDEPISNLDISHQLKIMSYLDAMADKGKGIVVVLHDLGFASRFCDRILVLSKGRMVDFDKPEKVLSRSLISRVFGVDAEVYRSEYSGSFIVDPVKPVN